MSSFFEISDQAVPTHFVMRTLLWEAVIFPSVLVHEIRGQNWENTLKLWDKFSLWFSKSTILENWEKLWHKCQIGSFWSKDGGYSYVPKRALIGFDRENHSMSSFLEWFFSVNTDRKLTKLSQGVQILLKKYFLKHFSFQGVMSLKTTKKHGKRRSLDTFLTLKILKK